MIWQSYDLLQMLPRLKDVSWGLAIFLAWIINLFITGIFAFSVFAFPTQKLLPGAYYKVRYPKQLKRWYKALNVELFRKMLLATLWKSQEKQQKYFNGKKDGIANLEEQSMKSEFGHLLPFLIINLVSIYMLTIGLTKLSLLTLLINIIGNLYPVILQRHHRMRIQIIRSRLKA